MKINRVMAILFATVVSFALVDCTSNNEGKKDGETKKCEDCVAVDDPGPTQFNPGESCTGAGTCKNNNNQLLVDLANQWCHDNNTDKCTGDCGTGNHCNGIYDPKRSKGLAVTANVDPKNPKNCKGGLVSCDAELAIPAAGLLACKCSCDPGK
jgi:hypothetical protein